jgi:hypothetical protein
MASTPSAISRVVITPRNTCTHIAAIVVAHKHSFVLNTTLCSSAGELEREGASKDARAGLVTSGLADRRGAQLAPLPAPCAPSAPSRACGA